MKYLHVAISAISAISALSVISAAPTMFAMSAVLMMSACDQERATPTVCRGIVDRIVELELKELGFVDTVLLEQKKTQMRRVFANELKQCEGRRIGREARTCIMQATSAEQISHGCFE